MSELEYLAHIDRVLTDIRNGGFYVIAPIIGLVFIYFLFKLVRDVV